MLYPSYGANLSGPQFLILCGRQVAEVTRNCETPDYPKIRVRSLRRPNPPSRPIGREGQSASRSDSPTIADRHVARPGCSSERGGILGWSGVSGFGRTPNGTALGGHEGQHH